MAAAPEDPIGQSGVTASTATNVLIEARKTLLTNGDWLTAIEIRELAEFDRSDLSAQLDIWKNEGLIFVIRHQNVDYVPSYALDPATGYRPRKTMADVLKVFDGRKDDWKLAFWFASDNSFLGGKRPQDILVRSPERVIAAAEDEVAGIIPG